MSVAPRNLLRCLLALACAALLRGEDVTAVANGDFALTVWETDDGLPHNSVSEIVQRPDGFLWVGTQGGLVRFDGLDFKPIRSPLLDGLKSASITSLIAEDRNSLLIGCPQSGLVEWRDGRLTRHPLASRIPAGEGVIKLFHEADGIFWVVFSSHELWRCHGGEVEKFSAPGAVHNQWPVSFATDAQGRVFVSRGDGIETYDAGKLQHIDKALGGSITIASSRTGGIWVAAGRRLTKLDQDRLSVFAAPWVTTMPPTYMFEDRDGALWLAAFEHGLIRWKDGHATAIATSHVTISQITQDNEGNVWIATKGGGLNRMQATRLALVANDPNWIDTVSGSICEDRYGHLWFANRKAVRRIDGDTVTVLSGNSGWPKRAMPIAVGAGNQLWLAVGGDLYQTDLTSTERPKLAQAGSGAIHAIFTAQNGDVWIGRNSGPLVRFAPDGTRTEFGPKQGYTRQRARCFGEDNEHHVWAGTEDGDLFELVGDRFVQPYAHGELPGHSIRVILGDADGNLWIGTGGGGMLLRHEGRLFRFGEAEGMPDEVISQILADDHGWLWFGSRLGICKILRSDLLACAAGRIPAVTPTSFGRADGLSGISAVGSYQPTAWKSHDGELWFVTRKGLVRTDPARQEDRRLPRVYLEAIHADGRLVDVARDRLTSGIRKFEFRFTAPTFTAAERVRFRYQLSGFDNEWVDGGTQRFANYPSLPPGDYVFTVAASTGDLVWSPEVASVAFTILPLWWETWWARALGFAIGFVALVAIVRFWSHRRLKARLARLEQERRIEQERVRIARNLHDDLGASLTHASMMAEELAEDWSDLPDPHARSAQLAQRVRTIARDLDAVVWTVSPKHDVLSSLAAYLCHYAEEYFRHGPIACRARVADNIPPLPLSPEVRHHLFLIAKELLNNVLKHSHARQVDVTLQMSGTVFELVVADDGCGFSVAEAMNSPRSGLKNLQARATEVGAVLDITSTVKGTLARLQFRPTDADNGTKPSAETADTAAAEAPTAATLASGWDSSAHS